MNKKQEIDLLTKLYNADTYFGNEISSEDFAQMINNINDDHPIFLSTSYSRAINYLDAAQKAIRELNAIQVRCQCRISEREGCRLMIINIADPYDEGEAIVTVKENDEGTDFILTTEFTYLIGQVPDKIDGFKRIGQVIGRLSFLSAIHESFFNHEIGHNFSILV